jgi:hypothetical protein
MTRSIESSWSAKAFTRFAAALFLAACSLVQASPALSRDKDYQGEDAGYLVYSVGTVSIGMPFTFSYRPTADGGRNAGKEWAGKIQPKLGGAIYLKVKNPDFSGEESGHVVVRRLPPGSYQVDKFNFGGSNLAGTSYHFSSAVPFALPFSIRPGEATYIGSFMRAPSLGTKLQPELGAAGFFVISDRGPRDAPIAKAKLPAAVPIRPEVGDVSKFGSKALRTSHP